MTDLDARLIHVEDDDDDDGDTIPDEEDPTPFGDTCS